MKATTRRTFVQRAAAAAGGLCAAGLAGGFTIISGDKKKSDIRIEDISLRFEEFVFRTPLKFARTVVDRQTMLTVNCTVRTAAGKEAKGFGTLPLNYTFTFPSKKLSPDARLAAMKALTAEIAKVTDTYKEFAHPIDVNWELAPLYLKA